MRKTFFVAVVCMMALLVGGQNAALADDSAIPAKPKAAVFPLGGNAPAELKDHVQFAFRAKLDRQGIYDPIDGPTMADLAGDKPITLATAPDALKSLASDEKPALYLWGELDAQGSKWTLRMKVLDTRDPSAKPREFTKIVNEETEMRFAIEEILRSIKGVEAFEHPVEDSVWNDAESKRLWAANPNLTPDSNFAEEGKWTVIYMDQKYAAPISEVPPAVDKVCILKTRGDEGGPRHNVLAMNLSKECAENNGMACVSEFIPIEPDTRYRLQFKYKSQGPSLHVFVKGYTMARSAVGDGLEKRECYKRQVPPSGATHGKWVTVVDDLNPQNPTYRVQFLRIDLYAYLTPGEVSFDDVELRAVGRMTQRFKDAAIQVAPQK